MWALGADRDLALWSRFMFVFFVCSLFFSCPQNIIAFGPSLIAQEILGIGLKTLKLQTNNRF